MNHPAIVRAWRRIAASALIMLAACTGSGDDADVVQAGEQSIPATQLFSRLPSNVTGIRFENRLKETSDLNVFTYRNFYNGGGVGAADLNGDGLPELVLTSNQEGPKLYLNQGHF